MRRVLTLLVLSLLGLVSISNARAAEWVLVGGNLRVTAVTFDPGASGVAYVAATPSTLLPTVILESRDAGVTWTPLAAEGLVNSFVQVLAVDEAGTLYAGTRGGGVYRLARDPL